MDPISAIGIVEGSFGLAIQFGSAAKTLHDVADKYKKARLTTKSLAQNLDILQLSWTQIGDWCQERFANDVLFDDESLMSRMNIFLETGFLVMEALEHDLQVYNVDRFDFPKRMKFIWNEGTLQGHQSRDLPITPKMTLYYLAARTNQLGDGEIFIHDMLTSSRPTPQTRAKRLREAEVQFRKSDESAYSSDSVVPSQKSLSTSQRDSYASGQSQDTIEYRQLSFEKGLFMSKVYVRSSKKVMVKELSRMKTGFKRKHTATVNDQTVMNWEAIRDQLENDSLLASSCEVSIHDKAPIKPHASQSRSPLFLEDKITSLTGMTLDEELIWACSQGNHFRVKKLADRGANLGFQSSDTEYSGMKSIHVAVMHGHINAVETLLTCGSLIEEEDAQFRWRPLHVAATNGQGAMVKFLIRKGSQIDARAFCDIQPIHEASRSGSIEALNALIEAGAAIDCSDRDGYQPLHCAAEIPNNSDIIRYLVRKGADIEATTHNRSRPLRLACTSDSLTFDTLLGLGAKVQCDDGSESILHAAVRLNMTWAVKILFVHGANPNRPDDEGKTILHDLAQMGFSTSARVEIYRLLLDNGAKVNMAHNTGDRVLHCLAALPLEKRADAFTTENLASLALDHGADIDALNRMGFSPLYLAMQGDNRPLTKLLLRSGARKLKKTAAVYANVQVTTLRDSQTPKYTVNIWRGLDDPEQRWGLSTQSFELSVDDEGYFDMVCEALGDEPVSRSGQTGR